METAGGGWTVIQRRKEYDHSTNFYRDWEEYTNGFGSPGDSHWLGLDVISNLTHLQPYVLRIDLLDWDGVVRFAEYEYFHVANSSEQFQLTVHGYSGTAGDALSHHGGMKFSTMDRDNDASASGNCAVVWNGAWWYRNCYRANLNGIYGPTSFYGINWIPVEGADLRGLKGVEMKIRTR